MLSFHRAALHSRSNRRLVSHMLDKLELLLHLARERHFGKAAVAAGITQPSLSGAIKSLELQFGVIIVERGSRFRGFTPHGERILKWARQSTSDARAMRQEVELFKRELHGEFKIGVIPTALPSVTELTIPFKAHCRAVRFKIVSLTSEAILQKAGGSRDRCRDLLSERRAARQVQGHSSVPGALRVARRAGWPVRRPGHSVVARGRPTTALPAFHRHAEPADCGSVPPRGRRGTGMHSRVELDVDLVCARPVRRLGQHHPRALCRGIRASGSTARDPDRGPVRHPLDRTHPAQPGYSDAYGVEVSQGPGKGVSKAHPTRSSEDGGRLNAGRHAGHRCVPSPARETAHQPFSGRGPALRANRLNAGGRVEPFTEHVDGGGAEAAGHRRTGVAVYRPCTG